jgi:putative polyketide hydroxylase
MLEMRVPVLIVGGGTVGLSAVVFLAHQRIPALLVERHPGTTVHPRAIGVGVRSMELYRSIGLEGAARAAASALANNSGFISVETLASADLPRLLAQRPPQANMLDQWARFSPTGALGCSQDALDPMLCDDARRHGATIAFGHQLVALSQDGDGVTAELTRLEDNAAITVRADYVIAADGASSTVRRLLDIPVSGPGALGAYLINALFEADLAWLVGEQTFQLCEVKNPQFTGLFIAIRGSKRWVLHIAYDPAKGQSPADFTPERCRELIRVAIGIPDIAVDVLSILPWQVAASVADRFRAGRIFLAGDAAHVVPPMGGYGMNTGIADVHNLAWKLALVLNGRAGAALLDSYDAERRPVAQFTMDQSYLRLQHPPLHWDATRVAERAQLGIAEQDVVHLGYRYPTEPGMPAPMALPSLTNLALDLDGSPGTRLPHCWIERAGERLSTLDLVAGRFTLIAGPDGQHWCDAATSVATRHGIDLAAHRFGPGGDLRAVEDDGCSVIGLHEDGALLVRPDGFIAWRTTGEEDNPSGAIELVVARLLALASV